MGRGQSAGELEQEANSKATSAEQSAMQKVWQTMLDYVKQALHKLGIGQQSGTFRSEQEFDDYVRSLIVDSYANLRDKAQRSNEQTPQAVADTPLNALGFNEQVSALKQLLSFQSKEEEREFDEIVADLKASDNSVSEIPLNLLLGSEAVVDEIDKELMDYVGEHYPTQAAVSALTDTPQGKQEHEAMHKDPAYAQLSKEIEERKDKVRRQIEAKHDEVETVVNNPSITIGEVAQLYNDVMAFSRNIAEENGIRFSISESTHQEMMNERQSELSQEELHKRVRTYDEKNGTELGRFVDFIERGRTLNEGEKPHFKVAVAGDLLQQYGIKGDIYTSTSTVNLNSHTDNADHHLSTSDWLRVMESVNQPLAITRYAGKSNSYRVYTMATKNGKSICLGMDVKSESNKVEISGVSEYADIKTAFGRDVEKAIRNEDILYPEGPDAMETIRRNFVQSSSDPNRQIYGQNSVSAAKVVQNFENPKLSDENNALTQQDADYLAAVERGDMQTAAQMVQEVAQSAGYIGNTDYQGAGSWSAPTADVDKEDFSNLDALQEAVENDTPTNVYGIINGISSQPEDVVFYPERLGNTEPAALETAAVLRQLRSNHAGADTKVKVYRAIPNDVKGDKLMAGDWVALSKQYSIDHGESRYGDGKYRIIENEVPIKELWQDGNDMREWGFDDGNNNQAEKNTTNNRKLLDTVTYDDNGNIIPLSQRFNSNNPDIRFSVSYSPETDDTLTETARQEMAAIRSKALADGTFMQAPNGKPTRLNERQWLQVRTQAFKDWFGDWELAAKAKTIKELKAISIVRNSLDRERIKDVYRNIGEVTNKSDGRKATFYHGVFGKMYKEGGLFAQVVPQLNDLFENSILVYSESDSLAGTLRGDGTIHKEHRNIVSYDNYVAKAEINDKEYYVRFTVQNEVDGRRGNHSLMVTNVALYENNNTTNVASAPTQTGERLDIDSITDAKLQQFFESAKSAEQNASKIVDENGEPLVVYHGTSRHTRSRFFQFRTENGGVWVTPSKGYADFFAENGEGKPTLYPLFATIHNPAYVGYIGSRLDDGKLQRLADDLNIPLAELARIAKQVTYTWELTASKPFADLIEKYGYDGIQAREGAVDTYAVLSPAQIKSATDNNGSFDENSDDIRFSIIGERGAANLDRAEAQYDELDYDTDHLTPAEQLVTDTVLDALGNARVSVEIVSEEAARQVLGEKGNAEFAKSRKSRIFVPTSKVPKEELAVAHHALFAKVQDNAKAGTKYGVYSAIYFHIFNGSQHIGALKIEGNEDLIDIIQNGINNGTYRNTADLNKWVKSLGSRQRYDSRNNANAPRQRGGNGGVDLLHSGQPTDSQRNLQQSIGDSGNTVQLRTRDGVIYGYAKGGKIYLTERGLNPNTPLSTSTPTCGLVRCSKRTLRLGNLLSICSRVHQCGMRSLMTRTTKT